MTRFLARRLLNYVVLLALASFLTFSLASADVPSAGEPPAAQPAAAAGRDRRQGRRARPRQADPVRYAHWASGAVRGDFGTTIGGQPVSDELWRRIGVSLRLLIIGSVRRHRHRCGRRRVGRDPAVPVQRPRHHRPVAAGDQHADVRDGQPADPRARCGVNSVLGVQLFEYTGETSPDAVGGAWNQFVDRLQHLVLPTFTLALGAIAVYSRYQRNAMLDVLGQDFIRTARAKGLTRRRALFKHGLRTALIPMATLFAYGFAGLVTGAVFTEKIFGWHGMGEWVVTGHQHPGHQHRRRDHGVRRRDVLLAGLLSDVIYAALDPRVRVGA